MDMQATSLSDFLADISDKHHDFEPPEMDYKLVYWNGKEREPLVIEGIDHNDKCIVLADIRRFDGSLLLGAETKAFQNSLRAVTFDLEFDEYYWDNVLAGGPLC